MGKSLAGGRVGYAPYSPDLDTPGDRRRFGWYAARRGLDFERARPGEDYDVVVVTAAADLPRWRRQPSHSKIVFELIDSYLAVPRLNLRALSRGVGKRLAGEASRLELSYRKTLERMCRRADAVVCATPEQREQIRELCPNVHIILDNHDEVTTGPKADYALGTPPTVVWEGLPFTVGALCELAPVINALHERHGVRLRVATDRVYPRYGRHFGWTELEPKLRSTFTDVEFFEWDQRTLGQLVTSSDIAILPSQLSDPMSAGKPPTRLLLFWRMGMPLVTAATPAYRREMRAAGLDLTSATHSEWISKLEELLRSEPDRRAAGTLGHRHATIAHSADGLAHQWDEVFRSVGFSVPAP